MYYSADRWTNIDVIGPGSKISVVFDQQGSIAEVEFDWAPLEILDNEEVSLVSKSIAESELNEFWSYHWGDKDRIEHLRTVCGLFDSGEGVKLPQRILEPACSVGIEVTRLNSNLGFTTSLASEYLTPMAREIRQKRLWRAIYRAQARDGKRPTQTKAGRLLRAFE